MRQGNFTGRNKALYSFSKYLIRPSHTDKLLTNKQKKKRKNHDTRHGSCTVFLLPRFKQTRPRIPHSLPRRHPSSSKERRRRRARTPLTRSRAASSTRQLIVCFSAVSLARSTLPTAFPLCPRLPPPLFPWREISRSEAALAGSTGFERTATEDGTHYREVKAATRNKGLRLWGSVDHPRRGGRPRDAPFFLRCYPAATRLTDPALFAAPCTGTRLPGSVQRL